MQMSVYEPGSQIFSLQVNHFSALIVSDSYNHSIGDGNIAFLYTVGKYVHNPGILQHQICRLQLACCS